jgi:TatD DNase family protein
VLDAMRENAVTHALCISVEMPAWPAVVAIAQAHDNIHATVGVHPDYVETEDPSVDDLVRKADTPKVVAIGETGLDYYRLEGDLSWQRDRFRRHIRAARETGKPLVIHTRSAASDTLAIMREERAFEVGGVMHCFTEKWDVAQGALDMGFHISFSGIVTFKNAVELHDVARKVPLEGMLIETDSPYLAPVPHRGKQNQPAFVRYVAEQIARLRGETVATIGSATSANFFRLFKIPAHA